MTTLPHRADEIDDLVDRFEAEWQSGRGRPSVERYLTGYAGRDRSRLVRELVCLDAVYRRQAGEPVAVAEYTGRLVEFARLSPEDQDWVGRAIERSAPAARTIPYRIGKYRIVQRVAEGGPAVVYRAYHPGLQTWVVLKHSKRPAAGRPVAEAATLTRLTHENLVRVYDADVHDGRPFVVLEDVPGRSLEEYAAAERPDARTSAALVAGAARGLGAAHGHGIYHLGLTPANIVVQPNGVPRVIDFGLARDRSDLSADDAGGTGGTLGYLSPEEAAGADRLDARTDVFGLGAVLYRLLTGTPPYADGSPSDLLARARARELDEGLLATPHIPVRLRRICLRALATDPADRYPRGDALADDLERFLRGRWRGWLRYAALLLVLGGLFALGGWLAGRVFRA